MSNKRKKTESYDNREGNAAENASVVEELLQAEGRENEVSKIEELIAETEKNKTEIICLKEEVARARADYYNFRTRVDRDRERDKKFAAEKAIDSLLPVFENLERVCAAVEDTESSLYKGVSMITKQFFDAMVSLGLDQIKTEGEYDPSLHEVVSTETVEDEEKDGQIVAVMRKGYRLAGRVIRAAQVRIGKYEGK
ncbi:MAG: nucleotide exchange factor GrpE [Synergistaceae bacterium]|jgi:molecular chaperone GrpE|nr:nucleotide exchange factor GrpE [Synergistaceae bacterium]